MLEHHSPDYLNSMATCDAQIHQFGHHTNMRITDASIILSSSSSSSIFFFFPVEYGQANMVRKADTFQYRKLQNCREYSSNWCVMM